MGGVVGGGFMPEFLAGLSGGGASQVSLMGFLLVF